MSNESKIPLGECDVPDCKFVAVWECGSIYDKKLGKIRMAKWCEKHCPQNTETQK